MKHWSTFLLVILATAVFGRVAAFVLPWWGLALAAALAGWLYARKGWTAFAGGLLGGALLWGAYAAAAASGEGQLLAHRMAELSGMSSSGILLLLVALIGGLVAGLAAWTGWQGRRAFQG
jgi:hypothetical protein